MYIFKKIILKVLCFLSVSILFTTFVYGEFYQYTDESGKLCFTDDISNIPEDQRDAVKKIESESQGTKTIDTAKRSASSTEKASAVTNEKYEENSFQTKIAELEATQAKLNEIRIALENERAAIEVQAPVKGTTKKERIAYSLQVEALNIKIAEYEKKINVFNNQVNELNAGKKKKVMNIK